MNQPATRFRPASKSARSKPREVVAVPLMSVFPGESPRLNGEDRDHIARLAETEAPLPPILVDRSTMRVIDGMHRLMAASSQGRETIDVVFFDGTEPDVFLRAVQENVTHGLPLTQADRRAAAERIIATHSHMSDRAIGQAVGLAAKTVAAIRKRSHEESAQSDVRVGRDGRVRPLNTSKARRHAAELLTGQPEASLRDVARATGISPATVLDVRKRLERGESPVTEKAATADGTTAPTTTPAGDSSQHHHLPARPAQPSAAAASPAATVQKLLRDPSLRGNDQGKDMLRLLHVNAVGAEHLGDAATAVPPHCVGVVTQLAAYYAKMWRGFAEELNGRARIIDPAAGSH